MLAALITFHPLDNPEFQPNPAEQSVAESLLNLGAGFVVRWGFYYADEQGFQQGEGDFLVLGSDGNALHIEVKSGPCKFDVKTQSWGTKDGGNPIDQRDKVWSAVLGMLKRHAAKSGRQEPWVHRVVALPDAEIPRNLTVYEQMPRESILDRCDLQNMQGWWKSHFGTKPRWPDVHERRAVFLELFARQLRPGISQITLTLLEQQMERFLSARFELLDALEGNKQFLFRGGPGTGKTWLALEQAARWARQGKRVLLLCYNLKLEEVLQAFVKSLGDLPIEVFSYETLSRMLFERCGVTFPEVDKSNRKAAASFFEVDLPKQLREISSLLDDEHRYDAMVVDEAQDHDTRYDPKVGASPQTAGWWELYAGMLLGGAANACVALFYDKAQRHFARLPEAFDPSRLEALFPRLTHVRLKRTLRYTQQIYDFLRNLTHPEIEDLLLDFGVEIQLPRGSDVVMEHVASAKAEKGAVENVIHSWCIQGECCPEDVLILYPTTASRPEWLKRSKLRGVPLESKATGGIRSSSVHKAKGLEALAVILVGMPPITQVFSPAAREGLSFTWFMGASRARQMLAVIERTDLSAEDVATM